MFGRVARRGLPWLRFAKLHLNKPQDIWNKVLWTNEAKVEMFDYNAQTDKHLIPTVHHADRGLMIFGLFCCHRTWAPCSHRVNHELHSIPK